MRKSLAALGAGFLVGATACAPRAQDGPARVTGPVELADTRVSTTAEVASRILLDEHFAGGWPDKPWGTAQVADGGYLVSARVPGDFVAIRAPLADVPRDIVVSATFAKSAGRPVAVTASS